MSKKIHQWLLQFEELSATNAQLYDGMAIPTIANLFQQDNLVQISKSNLYQLLYTELAKQFKNLKIQEFKSKNPPVRFKFCNIQPKNSRMWNYLWAKPTKSNFIQNNSTSKNTQLEFKIAELQSQLDEQKEKIELLNKQEQQYQQLENELKKRTR